MKTEADFTINHLVVSRPPFWYRLIHRFLKIAAGTLFRLHIVGAENIPAGNYIVVANHLSWIDPFLMMLALPVNPRLYLIGARQAVDRRWKAWLVRRFDMLIPFERGAAWMGKDGLKKSFQVLAEGAVLGIFPEGKVGPQEGRLESLERGIGHILLHANYPILPLAISGVKELYLGKPVTVIIGKPMRLATDGLERRTAIETIVAQVENALRMLIPSYTPPTPAIKLLRFLTNQSG